MRRRLDLGSDKRAAAHFEMIISFLFFTGFIFFLFTVLKPYNTSTLSGAVIVGMYDSFNDEVTTNLTNVFIAADYDEDMGPSDCFKVELPNEVFVYGLTETVVSDINDTRIDSNIEGASPTSGLNVEDTTENFYKVSISPDFSDNDIIDCPVIPNYIIGSVLEREVVSYKSLVAMKARYEDPNGYESLKRDLRIPEIFDYAIVTTDLPDVNMRGLVPDSGDIVANDYVLEVLYMNGTVVNTRFILMVW